MEFLELFLSLPGIIFLLIILLFFLQLCSMERTHKKAMKELCDKLDSTTMSLTHAINELNKKLK